ncbi:MAG: hypothetical protein PHT07_20895, partial [Paludibacter sp.]|nr:hypothetical protein [Paludibacter sp.]
MADNQPSVQAEAQSPVSVQEFAKRVKTKYPEYSDMDDLTLAKKIVDKYPDYKDMVSFYNPDPVPVPSGSTQQEQPLTYIQKELRQKFPENYTEEQKPVISAVESLHSKLPYVHVDENNQKNNQIIQSIPATSKDVSFNPNSTPKVGEENQLQKVIPQQETPVDKYFEQAKENTGGATINSNQPEEYPKFKEHPVDFLGAEYEDFLKSSGHNTQKFGAEIAKGLLNYSKNPLFPGTYANAALGDQILNDWQKTIPKDRESKGTSVGKIVPYVGMAIASILQPELAPATTAVWFTAGTGEGLNHADEIVKQTGQPMSELKRQACGIGYGTANTAIAAATGHLLSLPVGSFITKSLLKNSPELISGLESTLKSFAEQTPSGIGKALNVGGQYLAGAAKSSSGMFAMTGGKLATNKLLGENVGIKDVIDAAKESIASGIGFESVLFPFGYIKQTTSTIRRREAQGTVAISVVDGKPAEIFKSGNDYYQVSPKGITKKATEEDYNNAIIIPTDVFNKTIETKTISPTIQRDVYSGRTTDMLNRISDSNGNVHVNQDENGNSFYITGKDKDGNYLAVDTNGQTGTLPAESKIQTINKGEAYNALMAK